MKTFLFLIILFAIFSCNTTQNYVQRSDVAITDKDTSNLWILNSDVGPEIYKIWSSGIFGDKTKVFLINENEFNSLLVKSKRINEVSISQPDGVSRR